MPKLKHIELGLVPISANETLYKSASTLAMDHQCLREISLVFLPHGMILERGRKPRRDISGFFQVVVDEREQPVALIVTEETWFGMGSLPRKRRCVQLLSDEHKSKRMEYAPWASWIIMLPWLTVVAAMVIRLRR